MTREDIIRMAREAGLYDCIVFGRIESKDTVIERFAALVAAAEREACVKLCMDKKQRYEQRAEQPADIRDIDPQSARILGLACEFLAAAIRARGQDPMPLFDDWGGIPYKSCPPCNQQCNQGRDCPNA